MSRQPAPAAAEAGDTAPALQGGDSVVTRLAEALFAQSPFSSVLYDAEGHPLAVNAAFTQMWGVGLSSAPPGYSVLTDPELERQGVLPLVRRAFAGEVVTTPPVEYDIGRLSTTGEGRRAWTQGHFFPLRDASGAVRHVVLTHVDLTEHMAVAEALRASERRFAAMFEQATVGIALTDLDGSYLDVNDRFCEMTGRARSAVIGATFEDLTHPHDLPRNRPLFRRAVEHGEPFTLEKRYVRPDGTAIWVHMTGTPIRDERGVTQSVLGVCQDITARRRAETALRVLADTGAVLGEPLAYEATLQSAAELVVPALARWCLVFVEDAGGMLRMVGMACAVPEKTEKVRRLAAIAERLPGTHAQPARIAMATGRAQIVQRVDEELIQQITDDPEYHALAAELAPTSLLALPLIARGRVLGALVFVTDDPGAAYGEQDARVGMELARRAAIAIDNARLLAEAESARREAEAASRAKSDFLATISHELRTPLNAIGGYAELLEMGVHGEVNAEQRTALERIRHSQAHLLALINRVLSFSRVDARHLEVDFQPVRITDAFASCEPIFRPQADGKGVTLEVLPPEPSDLAALADAERLIQILLNLVSNAVKFTPAGGRVEVRARAEGDHALVVVRDTGIGIPAEDLQRIFEPFVQLGRRHDNPVEGTGLGLAISRDLARAMHGEITARSTPGQGSEFLLALPRA